MFKHGTHNTKLSKNFFKNHKLSLSLLYLLITTLHHSPINTNPSFQSKNFFEHQLAPSPGQHRALFDRDRVLHPTTTLTGLWHTTFKHTDNYKHFENNSNTDLLLINTLTHFLILITTPCKLKLATKIWHQIQPEKIWHSSKNANL